MVIVGGCGALGNDTNSQKAIAAATAASMGVQASNVIYSGCSAGSRRRLSGGGGQTVAASNLVTVPMQQFASSGSTAADAQNLFVVLQNKIQASFASGNFTKTLKTASISLGAKVTANVNSTALGKTSALVVVFPPTSAPTVQPTAAAPVSSDNKASSDATNVGLIVGVVVAVVVLIIAVFAGWYYLVFGSRHKRDLSTNSATVPPLAFSSQVYPLDTGTRAAEQADIISVTSPSGPDTIATVSIMFFYYYCPFKVLFSFFSCIGPECCYCNHG